MYGYIYKTTNLINGKIYIGKHKGEFTTKYLGSGRYLNNAINKYGEDNFKVELIEYCNTLETQNEREQYWIKHYLTLNYDMYNISKGGDGGDTYYKLSAEDREKRIEKLRRNSHFVTCDEETKKQYHKQAWETRQLNGKDKFTEEQKFHMSEAHKGKTIPKDTIEKIVASRKGYKHSEATKLKISAGNKGKIVSVETRNKISANNKGKHSGENNGFYGKHHTEETKQKISDYNKQGICGMKGKTLTEEQKLHHSYSMKGKNKGKWMNDGVKIFKVNPEDVEKFLNEGYKLGRKIPGKVYKAWNKGLSAKTDERVALNIQHKLETERRNKNAKFGNTL